MSQNKKRAWIIAPLGVAILLISSCALSSRMGKVSIIPPAPLSDAVISTSLRPAKVKIKAFVTGWVEAPADILMDQSDPATPEALKAPQWVPSLAYVIEHPTQGSVIMDAGLRSGPCDYGLRPIYWVPCRNDNGSDIVSQLIAQDIGPENITAIAISHFHGDHISGLSELLTYTDAPLLMSKTALKVIRSPFRALSGVPTDMLSSDMHAELMDPHFQTHPVFGQYMDIFKDGSLKLFQTPGHTDGHISAFAQGETYPVILAFDAAHLQANYDLNIPSGAVSSKHQALESLALLKKVKENLPSAIIIFGHEPSQWACKPQSVELGIDPLLSCPK